MVEVSHRIHLLLEELRWNHVSLLIGEIARRRWRIQLGKGNPSLTSDAEVCCSMEREGCPFGTSDLWSEERERETWKVRWNPRDDFGVGLSYKSPSSFIFNKTYTRHRRQPGRMGSVPLVVGGFSKLFLKAGCKEVRVDGLNNFLQKLNKERGVLTSKLHQLHTLILTTS